MMRWNEKTVRVGGLFLYVLKKFFWLDTLLDNTFKENGELLGRKSLKIENPL